MEFNEKLRLLRKNAGLTQRQVADAVGVTYRTYQNYEAGASMPAGDTASRLAAALGVSTDTLLSAAPASAPEAPDRALRAVRRGDRRGAGADTVDPRDGAAAGGL